MKFKPQPMCRLKVELIGANNTWSFGVDTDFTARSTRMLVDRVKQKYTEASKEFLISEARFFYRGSDPALNDADLSEWETFVVANLTMSVGILIARFT